MEDKGDMEAKAGILNGVEHKEEESKEEKTVDELIQYVGEFKLFQWLVGVMFCVMMIPSTFQVFIMYFASLDSDWRCHPNSTVCTTNGTFQPDHKNDSRCSMSRTEWEFVQPIDYSIVTEFDLYCDKEWYIDMSKSVIFLGSMLGSIITGWLADNYGRKMVMFISMGSILLIGFINSFISNLQLFIAFRFAVGIFVPGTNIQMSVLLSEMTGAKFRPLSGNLNWTFFPVALCILTLKGYFIRKWRILFLVCTAPYVLVMLFYFFIPESVRWLKLHDKNADVMNLFRRIGAWNKRQLPDNVTVIKSTTKNADVVMKRKSNPTDLFRTAKMMFISVNIGYGLLMHGIVYYGLGLAADEIGYEFYLAFFLLSFIEIPACLLSIGACALTRKFSTIVCVFIAGASCITLAIIPQEYNLARIICGMIGKLCIALSFNTIGIWAIELYPTEIRGQGMCFINIMCRIGAFGAPWVSNKLNIIRGSVQIQFIFLGGFALTSFIFMFFLHETKDLPTVETVQSNELIGNEDLLLCNVDVPLPKEAYVNEA